MNMSNNTKLLLFLLAIFFFFPDADKNGGGNAGEKLDKYVAAQYEGYIAFAANEASPSAPTPAPAPTPPDEKVVKCQCGGTGKIRMPDGNYVQCSCGPTCTCKKSNGAAPVSAPPVEDVKKKTTHQPNPFPPIKMISVN